MVGLVRSVCLAALSAILLVNPILGDDSDSDATQGPSGPLSKLQVHGFLTQAWATTDFVRGRPPGPDGPLGPTFDEQALGIPEDGTFNYRAMALQFRYEITPQDIMVAQFSSRELGDSPITQEEEDIQLDWAFFEHRFPTDTTIKVGRVQIPLGIYNEIRDVGTILPFFRPPFVFYREGSFTSETVDGLVIGHTFWPSSSWSFEADVYGGFWESFELLPASFGSTIASVAENEGYGVQFWLNTPVSGLRFGLGGHHRDITKGAEGLSRAPGDTTRIDDWYASIDGSFNKFMTRAEYRQFANAPAPAPGLFSTDFRSVIDYIAVTLGYYFTEKFHGYIQYENNGTKNSSSSFTNDFDVDLRTDIGVALNYSFKPYLVLKAEYHEVEAEDFLFAPVFTPGGLLLAPFNPELDDGSYSIISLSASF